MGIKLKTEEGAEFSFDTVAEFMEFKKQIDAEEASKESEDEIEVPESEFEVEVGDKVRIVSSEDGTDTPYHYHDVGSVGKVVSLQQYGRIEVEVGGEIQFLLPHHYEKVESLGKDANGEDELLPIGTKVSLLRHSSCEDLRPGDVGTITNLDERCPMGLVYSVRVRSGEDGFGWAKREDVEVVEDEHEFKVGDKVEVVGNRARHDVDEGEVREITRVDSEEPKYNLSKYSCGSWAHSEDIKLAEEDTQKIEVGDLVYVRESFTDYFGDEVKIGTYAKVRGFGSNLFLTGVLVENKEQLDKLVLVAKKEDISI